MTLALRYDTLPQHFLPNTALFYPELGCYSDSINSCNLCPLEQSLPLLSWNCVYSLLWLFDFCCVTLSYCVAWEDQSWVGCFTAWSFVWLDFSLWLCILQLTPTDAAAAGRIYSNFPVYDEICSAFYALILTVCVLLCVCRTVSDVRRA